MFRDLKTLRQRAGYSLDDVAILSGVDITTLSRVERGCCDLKDYQRRARLHSVMKQIEAKVRQLPAGREAELQEKLKRRATCNNK